MNNSENVISHTEATAERLYPDQVTEQKEVAPAEKQKPVERSPEDRVALGNTQERMSAYVDVAKGSINKLTQNADKEQKQKVQATTKEFAGFFSSIHADPADAARIAELHVSDLQNKPNESTMQARYEETVTELQKEWGKNYDGRIAQVQAYLEKFPKIKAELGPSLYHKDVYLPLARKIDKIYS